MGKAEEKGAAAVEIVGHINKEIYRCISEHIVTDQVILTAERAQHIRQRHPGHMEIAAPHLAAAIWDPDYILQDRHPNTGLILKECDAGALRIEIVLHIHTAGDTPGFCHSVLSVWKIREREYHRLLRSKKVLYKRG